MAENYIANKMDLSSIHNGVKYKNGQSPNVDDFNKMVEGIAYAQQTGGTKFYKHNIYHEDVSGYPTYNTIVISTRNTEYTSQEQISNDFNTGIALCVIGGDGHRACAMSGSSLIFIDPSTLNETLTDSFFAVPIKYDDFAAM